MVLLMARPICREVMIDPRLMRAGQIQEDNKPGGASAPVDQCPRFPAAAGLAGVSIC
jgi:hypothetical protein